MCIRDRTYKNWLLNKWPVFCQVALRHGPTVPPWGIPEVIIEIFEEKYSVVGSLLPKMKFFNKYFVVLLQKFQLSLLGFLKELSLVQCLLRVDKKTAIFWGINFHMFHDFFFQFFVNSGVWTSLSFKMSHIMPRLDKNCRFFSVAEKKVSKQTPCIFVITSWNKWHLMVFHQS